MDKDLEPPETHKARKAYALVGSLFLLMAIFGYAGNVLYENLIQESLFADPPTTDNQKK